MKMNLAVEVVKSNLDRMLLSMMIDNIKGIEDCGIDIAVIGGSITPIEIEPEYLRELYLSVLEKSSLPIALCHFNRVLPASLLGEILLHPEVILVKNCSNDLAKTVIILNTAKGRKNTLFTLSGNELNCVSSAGHGYRTVTHQRVFYWFYS